MITMRGCKSVSEPLIQFVLEQVFPLTLDVLSNEVPHIIEMTQRLQASLNLYLLLKIKFKDEVKHVEKSYFENVLKALKTAEDGMAKDEFDASEEKVKIMGQQRT